MKILCSFNYYIFRRHFTIFSICIHTQQAANERSCKDCLIKMASFLSLPTEIRLQIYRELRIYMPKHNYLSGPLEDYLEIQSCSWRFLPAILRVNKQIHQEAEPEFCASNTFVINATSNFARYVGSRVLL